VPAAKAQTGISQWQILPAGWPSQQPGYLGRYRMTWSSDHIFAGAGLLTLFIRQVSQPSKMNVPSGVLSVYGQDETAVFYLTKFRHEGARGYADVSTGNFGYPAVGQIKLLGLDIRRHALTLVFTPVHGGPVQFGFIRYSSSPHP
jgi:hypothetical protein